MKKIFLVILLFACVVKGHGKDNDTVATKQDLQELSEAVQSTIDLKTADLSDSLAKLVDTVNDMSTAMSYKSYFDSATVAFYEKHPEKLYHPTKVCIKYTWIYNVLGWVLFAFFIVYGLYLFATSSLCRNDSYDTSGKLKPLKERSYSYSRVQLFWWTLIILSCYIAFFAQYGTLIPLNMTTVILLGLGVTVFAGGKIIDQRQIKQKNCGARIQDKDSKDASFLNDILSDDNGISIHRFQTVIFNLAFGIGFISYFVTAVCNEQYPFAEFNQWQFALLGISSAAYLGLKAAENSAPGQSAPASEKENEGEGEATRNINNF